MFATVGELAGAWQGLRAKVRQSSHCSVQFGAVAVAVDVLETNARLFPARDGGAGGGGMHAPGMTDTSVVMTATQGARETQLVTGVKESVARQSRARIKTQQHRNSNMFRTKERVNL